MAGILGILLFSVGRSFIGSWDEKQESEIEELIKYIMR